MADKPYTPPSVDVGKIVDEIMLDQAKELKASGAVEKNMQPLARDIDKILTQLAGTKVPFALFVFTDPPKYVSNYTHRPHIVKAITWFLDKWKTVGGDKLPTEDTLKQ